MKLNTPPEPSTVAGPKFADYLGKTLILIPEGLQEIVSEQYGTKDGVQCAAYVWEGDKGTEIEGGLTVLQNKVREQLRPFIGTDEAVLGTVGRDDTLQGNPFVLRSVEEKTANKVAQWLAAEEF